MLVAQKVAAGRLQGRHAPVELDGLAAETAASMTSKHPDYARVRSRGPLRSRLDPARLSPTTSRLALFSGGAPVVFANNTLFKRLGAAPADATSRTAAAARRSHRRLQPPQEHQRGLSRRRACPKGRPSPFSGDASREYSNSMSKRERFKYSKPEGLACGQPFHLTSHAA